LYPGHDGNEGWVKLRALLEIIAGKDVAFDPLADISIQEIRQMQYERT